MNEENEKESSKKNKITVWYIINPILFIVSLIAFNLGINVLTYLNGMGEYEFGIGMIFFWPIIVFFFAIFMIIIAIVSVVFEIKSIKLLINNGNKIFKTISILEICSYSVFILIKIFL